jgi:hypothetical protein
VKDVYRDGEHDAPNKRRDNHDPIPETVHRCKRQAKQMLLQKSWSAASRLRGEGAYPDFKVAPLPCCESFSLEHDLFCARDIALDRCKRAWREACRSRRGK